MKKNILKIILIICILLVILLAINIIRNYTIVNEICESEENLKNSLNNYYYEETINYINEGTKTTKTEIYVLDGIYVDKNYIDGELEGIFFKDSNTGEVIKTNEDLATDRNIENLYKNMLLTGTVSKNEVIKTILLDNIFTPIQKKENHYIIKFDNFTVYVDINTKLVDEWRSGDVTTTKKKKKDVVTIEDIQKPNV